MMAKKFVIGDRVKDEWISVLDTEKKKLEFTNHLASAKEYNQEENAAADLKELQTTGYFGDLMVYMKEDGKAYKASGQSVEPREQVPEKQRREAYPGHIYVQRIPWAEVVERHHYRDVGKPQLDAGKAKVQREEELYV